MAKIHAVIEIRGNKTETLCGIEADIVSRFGIRDQNILLRSAKARSMIEAVAPPHSKHEFNCINCQCVWRRITAA